MAHLETVPYLPNEPFLPILQSGDFLHSREFLRRYERMPEVKKAELIFNLVFIGGPVSHHFHGKQESLVHLWLGTYAMHHPGTENTGNTTLILDADNTVLPDAFLFYPDKAEFTSERYLNSPPELVVEIAASTASIDTRKKKQAYERAEIREYIVWRVLDEQIDFWAYEKRPRNTRQRPWMNKGAGIARHFPAWYWIPPPRSSLIAQLY